MYANDLWEPHFVTEAAVCLYRRKKENEVEKSQARGRLSCTNHTNTRYMYHYYYQSQRTDTHTHNTRIVCFGYYFSKLGAHNSL